MAPIVFTQGCNFRCSYCHNPDLIKIKKNPNVSQIEIINFLKKRKGKLDGLVITGGEPTLQNDLISFIGKIKKLNYSVKLDTNGSKPDVLKEIFALNLVDYIAMDLKAPLKKYSSVTKSNIREENILKSIHLIMNSGIEYEFRTTVLKSQLSIQDLLDGVRLIKGAELFMLQKCNTSYVPDENSKHKETYSDSELSEIKKLLSNFVVRCEVR
jgi:pyruvate formate lyase activating enzyme